MRTKTYTNYFAYKGHMATYTRIKNGVNGNPRWQIAIMNIDVASELDCQPYNTECRNISSYDIMKDLKSMIDAIAD